MECKLCTNDISGSAYCVYKHTNIVNGKVYIGITCQDPKIRWSSGHGYRKNEYFWRSIQKYGWNDGFLHEILYEDLTYEDACKIEIELISKHNSTNPNYGYNHHQGGKYNDYETRQKISENHASKKEVLQYSKDGEFLAEYKSRSEASRFTGIGVQEISFACTGTIFSAGGYFWCDKDNPNKIKLDLEKYRANMEHVLQFDLSGNLICDYKHIYDASECTGIDRHEIWNVCFEKLKPLNGFLFCYKSKEARIQKWIKKQYVSLEKLDKQYTNTKKKSAGPKYKKK